MSYDTSLAKTRMSCFMVKIENYIVYDQLN